MSSKVITFEYEDLTEYKSQKYLPMKIILLNLLDEVDVNKIPELNAQLMEGLKLLPIPVSIIKRTELEVYIEKGFDYLLTEQKALQSRVDPTQDYGTEWQGGDNQILYKVYRYSFIDLETLESYYFFSESPTRLPYNLKKVTKRIKKEFGE